MSPEELQELLPYTEHFNLNKDQRIELVKTVWGFMESFVDEAWGVHPVQLSCEQLEPDHLQSHNPDSLLDADTLKKNFYKELSHDGKTTH